MDHREYIERYLSADADDELSSAERRKVSAHLAGCAQCRERLQAERALKAIIRAGLPTLSAPQTLRERIRTGMDEIDRAALSRRRLRGWVGWTAAAAALAAALAFAIINFRGQPRNPMFDTAIASFERAQTNFAPSAGTRSADELALTMINQFGIAMVWDFSSMGLTPVGARVEHTADGRPVAYTLYTGGKGSLLCIIKREDVMPQLSGGTVVKGIHIFRYKGFTIAATNSYAVFCVMVTNLPPDEVARAFAKPSA